jgi:hypothetical protein
MSPDVIQRAVSELIATYGETVRCIQESGQLLVRIDDVELYDSCTPTRTKILLVLNPAQPKPLFYVSPGQTLSNGRLPKNSSNEIVAGESWMRFSFNIPWENGEGIIQFIASIRQRFAQSE